MNYTREFRKFISSQHLYAGIRITAGVLIPAVLLYQYDVLPTLIAIPLGALFTSLADNPGPAKHRRNGMLISIAINLLIVLITGYSRTYPWLIGIEIVVFGIFFSLISVYGNRANSIGLIALIVFILMVDQNQGARHVLLQGAFFLTGGLWYAILSLVLYTFRPYRPVQQLLGESLMEMADYFNTRAMFYRAGAEPSSIYTRLFQQQVRIQQHFEESREMLFSTRRFVSESTQKGRSLMIIFQDSVDLFERIMTAQQDYTLLHQQFDDTGILNRYYQNIRKLAAALHRLGLAVQSAERLKTNLDLQQEADMSETEFNNLRKSMMHAGNVEGFISLRHILYSIRDLTDRIIRIQSYTSYDAEITISDKTDIEIQNTQPRTDISIALLRSNLSMRSSAFRHAIRLTLALVVGYILSLLFPIGHGYWILLTIATIIRPAYSLTKERNIQRLLGTLAGIVLGFALLYVEVDNRALFAIMVISMIIAYSLLKINYGVSIAGLTIFLLISFHFLDPMGLQDVLEDRIFDTVAGCAIAFFASLLVFPSWEREQIQQLMKQALLDNKTYFSTASSFFSPAPVDNRSYKLARKDAFVALANLSDAFQRMLSEPKNQQKNLQLYHQFVTTNHMLTSYIASLSHYAQKFGNQYTDADFEPVIKRIRRQFDHAILLSESGKEEIAASDEVLPMNKKVNQLLQQRKKDLEKGIDATPQNIRKTLSDLKAVSDQFLLVFSMVNEQVKVLRQINRG